jgi:putative NIF3 family GTP cyclohydrolase 1 type 2
MPVSEGHLEKMKSKQMNVIVAGHMANDTMGMNFLLDTLENKGRFDIIECSGFKRVRR